jgi:hypothetical protein
MVVEAPRGASGARPEGARPARLGLPERARSSPPLREERAGRGRGRGPPRLDLSADPYVSRHPAYRPASRNDCSRRARNSEPGFQVGHSVPFATSSPTAKSSRVSSTMPAMSQSGFTSSLGLW